MLETCIFISLILLLGLLVLTGILIQQIAAARREAAAQSGTVNQLSQQLELVRTRQEGLTQTLETKLSAGQEQSLPDRQRPHTGRPERTNRQTQTRQRAFAAARRRRAQPSAHPDCSQTSRPVRRAFSDRIIADDLTRQRFATPA